MLNGTLTLHDIRDTEAFVTAIIKRSRLQLSTHDHEDLTAYLIEQAWELSLRYDPNGRPSRFSVIATERLRQRITDWLRTNKEDRRYPIRFNTVPLDDQLADTLTETRRHPPPDRSADHLVRLLRTRSSDEAWRHHQHRKTLPRRAA